MMKRVKPLFAAPAACVAVICLVLLHSVTAFAAEDASALEPERPTASDGRPLYTEETRPDFPVFNSLVGEENFLSITGPDGQTVTDYLELRMGEEYDVAIAYDNNSNPRGVRTHAIASETIMKVDFPETIADERPLTATISAANSQPKSVSSSLTLVAAEPMALEIVPGSAKIVNNNPTNGAVISEHDLTHDGAAIGTNSMIGIVLYGPENAGSVVFKFRTLPIDQSSVVPSEASGQDITIPAEPVAKTPPKLDILGGWSPLEIISVIGALIVLVIMLVYFIGICHSTRKRRRR